MSAILIDLPEELKLAAEAMAVREKVSLSQLLASAMADKLAAENYINARAKRGDRGRFEEAISRVADVEPDPIDALPGSK